MKKTAILLILFCVFIIVACEKTASFKQVSTDSNNIGIKGFDTVAFFAEVAVKGDPKFEFVWNGAKWLFSNAENLEKFKKNPEQFVPQFGGYCSYSMSHGRIVESDPNIYKIEDKKLYLLNNPQAKGKWEADQNNLIEAGEKNWEELKTKPAK